MPTESGLKLRTKLESAKTLKYTNVSTNTAYAAGEMTVVGETIGAFVEAVGTSGAAESDTYPNGPDGILVYEAEKVVLPKTAGVGQGFSAGDLAYYDATNQELTPTTTSNTKCAVVLEDAATSATEVLVDLMVLY